MAQQGGGFDIGAIPGFIVDLLSSPFGQLVMTIFGGLSLQEQQDAFNADSQKALDDIISGSKGLEARLSTQVQEGSDETQQLIEDLTKRSEGQFSGANARLQAFMTQLGQELSTDFATRNKRVEDLLEGTNEQTITDINRSFDNRQQQIQQNLITSGLSSGTTGIEPGNLVERERGDTIASARQGHAFNLANIIADLEGERIGTARDVGFAQADFDRAFTGQQIDTDIMLRGAGIDAFSQGNRDLVNIMADMGLFRLNAIQNVNRIPPDPTFFQESFRQFGQSAAGTPDQPSTAENLAPGAIQGVSMIAAAKIFVGCIDLNSFVKTPDGLRTLSLIVPGDFVMGTDDQYHDVLAKVKHEAGDLTDQEFRNIVTVDGKNITLTADHTISGKPASDWKTGDEVHVDGAIATIKENMIVKPVRCGDLLLKDSAAYYANGFPVDSGLREVI